MDELLQRAAENMGMPPALAERSARARADKEGTTVEAVLAEWAGEPVPDQAPAGTPAEPATQADALDSPNEGADSPPAAAGAPEPQSASTAPPPAPTEVTTDYLVALAADAKRMPEKLVRSSGEARARNEGSDLDVVLAKWAGVDLEDLRARAEAGEPLPVAEPESPAASRSAAAPADDQPEAEPAPTPAAEQAPAQAAPAAAAAAMSVDELLDKAAEAKGMPAPIAKRSAEARAKKDGTTLEAVLAEWAGIDPSAVGPAAEPADAQPAPTAPAAAPAPEPDQAGSADIEVIEPTAADGEQDLDTDDVEPVGARSGGYPAWLAAAFVIIPLLAVTYILVSPNGPDCGTGGQLNVDPVTGLAVNCDGSEYGGASVDFFAQGAGIYAQCAACHGTNGEGGGNFPAFTGGAVLATFPEGQCSDHVEWVALGTANFPEDTYGATAKPVGGSGAVMPGYEGVLTPEQIASVVLYERVQFGGEPLEVAEVDCGLVVPEGEDGATTDGEMTEASSP